MIDDSIMSHRVRHFCGCKQISTVFCMPGAKVNDVFGSEQPQVVIHIATNDICWKGNDVLQI